MSETKIRLSEVLDQYSRSFSSKIYTDDFDDTDVLMDVFGITQELKKENKQYWGRELGKCWENLVRELFKATCSDFALPKRFGADEPADFFVGNDAIDTKYRVGSGDSGTLKKFARYGRFLQTEGFNPVFLFLRTDNLRSALSKMNAGGWTILMGDDAFDYILNKTKFNLKSWLVALEQSRIYKIERDEI